MPTFEYAVLISLDPGPDPFDAWAEALKADGVVDVVIVRDPAPLELTRRLLRFTERRRREPALLAVAGRVTDEDLATWRFPATTLVLVDQAPLRDPARLPDTRTLIVTHPHDDEQLAWVREVSTTDLARRLREADPWSPSAGQLGPENNGFVEYEVRDPSGTIGRLVVTGERATDLALGPNRAAWSWNSQRAAFPDEFLIERNKRGTGTVAPDAWRFEDGPFPKVPDAVASLDGFTVWAISRTQGGPPIGHLWCRGNGGAQQQLWTGDPHQLDGSGMFADRDLLWFARVPAPPIDDARQWTTLSP